MQKIILSLSLMVGSAAQAAELYNCLFKAESKRSSAEYQVKALISRYNLSKVKLLNTELEVGIRQNELYGFVNGQYNFILGGAKSEGHFESATEKGSIQCSDLKSYSTVYRIKTLDILFVPGVKGLRKTQLSVYDINNTCYMGSTSEAVRYLNSLFGPSLKYGPVQVQVPSKDLILKLPHRTCLKDNGADMHEWECLKYSDYRPKIYEMENCYRDNPNERP